MTSRATAIAYVAQTNQRGISPVLSQMVAVEIMNTAPIRSAYVLVSVINRVWPNVASSLCAVTSATRPRLATSATPTADALNTIARNRMPLPRNTDAKNLSS